MSVFAYASTDKQLNIFAVGEQMEARGWQIDRLQNPEGLHAMVVPGHARIVDAYLTDLAASVQAVRDNPDLGAQGNAAMYGMIAKLPFRGVIRKEVMKMMEELYGPGGGMPMEGGKNPWLVKTIARLMQGLGKRQTR